MEYIKISKKEYDRLCKIERDIDFNRLVLQDRISKLMEEIKYLKHKINEYDIVFSEMQGKPYTSFMIRVIANREYNSK